VLCIIQTRIIFICFSGFNGLIEDTKLYYQISKEVWKGKELHTFSRKEQRAKSDNKILKWVIVSSEPNENKLQNRSTVKPVLRGHLWDNEKVAL
jgi:hypothetical protein